MRVPRRDVLRGLGALTTGLPLGSCGPGGARLGTGGPLAPPPIENLVPVMMENRSFDHYFGSYTLVEGRPGIDGLLANMTNRSPLGGTVAPAPMPALCFSDPPHDWDSSHAQFDNGSNQGFAEQYYLHGGDPAAAMGYADRALLPVSYALADHYAVCQRRFASVMGPTWPNRFYSHGAQSQGMKTNDLPEGGVYTMRTIYEALDEAGIGWSYYWSDAPFVLGFGALAFRDEVRGVDEFFADCAAGTLPPVSVVEPGFTFNDDHPPKNPLLGQLFLARVHAALAASPQWGRSLLVICYDEHGGLFDHVPPPKTDDDRVEEGFDQLGFRVPALVCGPWVKPSHVSDVVRDHTSWLAEIEQRFGIDPLTRRDAAANDLSELLVDQADVPLEPADVPVIALTEEEILAQCGDGGSARISGQPELDALIDRYPRFDRRNELDRIAREHIARAEALGVLRIR
jgi:phospholipase C